MSPTTPKRWTVLVYFAGDNNLTPEMARALEEIIRSCRDTNLNIYVYFDSLSRDVPTLYCDLNEQDCNGRRTVTFFRSHKIRPKLIERERLFNENSASMNNILNFVHWCVQRDGKGRSDVEDRDYALIFSGHSFGFLDWGLFKDTNSDYYMTLSKLRWLFERITYPKSRLDVIAQAEQEEEREDAERENRPYHAWSTQKLKERTTPVIGKPVSLLGFDSCEMGTLEIASQFKKVTKTLVASAGSVPNAGWNFAQILSVNIADHDPDNGDLTPARLAVRFVERFIKQQSSFALADKAVDMAAWDITKLPDVEAEFARLCDDMIRCFKGGGNIVHQQMRRLLAHVHVQCQTYLLEQHIDLGDFCKLLISEIDLLRTELAPSKITEILEVRESCKRVIRAIRQCILLSGFAGKDRQFTNGIALFFPWSLESYREASKDYQKLSFIRNRATGRKWKVFLKLYLKKVSRRRAVALSPVDENGKVVITEKMPSVVYRSYVFADNDIFGFPFTEELSGSGDFREDKRPPDGDKRPPDGDKRPPDGDKRPPDGDKRPPDGDKRPPDGDKLSNNLPAFLSHFMRMKNIHARWNQTGFDANTDRVEFVADDLPPDPAGGDGNGKIRVTIPQGRTVQRR